jgi:hypothetical protein
MSRIATMTVPMTMTSMMATTIGAKICATTQRITARIHTGSPPFLMLSRIRRNDNHGDRAKERNDPSQYRLRSFLRATQSCRPSYPPSRNDVQKHREDDSYQNNCNCHDILHMVWQDSCRLLVRLPLDHPR